jgi:hypothetical protein
MGKRYIALLAQALLVAAAHAQTPPAAFAEAAQKSLVQQYCDKDGRFMECLGVDIKKDAARCAELIRSNWAFCRSTFMMTAPSSIPASDARSYGDNLADCARTGAVAASGKSAGAVDACMAAAR